MGRKQFHSRNDLSQKERKTHPRISLRPHPHKLDLKQKTDAPEDSSKAAPEDSPKAAPWGVAPKTPQKKGPSGPSPSLGMRPQVAPPQLGLEDPHTGFPETPKGFKTL